jgi:hypothetical protein
MIEMDYRNVSCGGDPFNFLMSSIKSIQIEIEHSDTVKVMLIKDKFPYDNKTFERIVNYCKLSIVDICRENNEIYLLLRK